MTDFGDFIGFECVGGFSLFLNSDSFDEIELWVGGEIFNGWLLITVTERALLNGSRQASEGENFLLLIFDL